VPPKFLSLLYKKLADPLYKRYLVNSSDSLFLVSRSFHSPTLVLFIISLTVLFIIHFRAYFNNLRKGPQFSKKVESLFLR